MKRILLALFVVLLLCPLVVAQVPVVTSAYHVAWDNPNEPGVVTGSKLYLSRDSAFVPGPENLVATIPGDGGGNGATIQWAIVAEPGTWFARVSFTFLDVNGDQAETETPGPLEFYVIGNAQNLRIEPPQD